MHRLSDNYYHRKCYLKYEQVPTQTVMKNKMGKQLALTCFNSLEPKEKILAGLEPLLKGGGSVWYMPPEETLLGRHVLIPVDAKHLKILGVRSVGLLGKQFQQRYFKRMFNEQQRTLLCNSKAWKKAILESNEQHYNEYSLIEAKKNTDKLNIALDTFEHMYRKSVVRIEEIAWDAAIDEIKCVRAETFSHMKNRFTVLVDGQSRKLYGQYEEYLKKKKAIAKSDFVSDIETVRSKMGNEIRDIIYEKHLIIEKFRHFFMCKTLACQVYVALKEKEECDRKIETTTKYYKKKTAQLKQELDMKEFEIHLATAQNQKRQEFTRIWKNKVCHIVKKFKTFVLYCLVQLPQHAEFFMDMEKLMLLQISKALENPETPSIIETEPKFATPVLRPQPFYLFCDKGYKLEVDQSLCPCTSSAADVPVIVINKRCIYSGCDTFGKFLDKVADHNILGDKCDDEVVYDDHIYEKDVPVKITSSQQLRLLKLESSLMQILQSEIPRTRELPVKCRNCNLPFCFCNFNFVLPNFSQMTGPDDEIMQPEKVLSAPGNKIQTEEDELARKSKRKNSNFVENKSCHCIKKITKHNFEEHIPPYMRTLSPYEPGLPYYEKCDLSTLKKIVKASRESVTPPPSLPKVAETKTLGVQYSDTDFDHLCACFSEDELSKLLQKLKGTDQFDVDVSKTKCSVVGSTNTGLDLAKSASSFATHRAFSLRNLLDNKPSLQEIFQKKDCRDFF